jgi:uncharacterized protein (TIGR02001 family)
MEDVMTFKTFIKTFSLGAAALCIASPALAQDMGAGWSMSGNAAFKTDYVFRGFSQTDEEPAVQGTIAANHESGFSASLWGSNVDFNDGDEAASELDATASYTVPVGPGKATLGGVYYGYPGSDSDLNYDYIEGFVSYALNIEDAADLTAQVFYSPDFFAGSGDAVYTTALLSVPVPVAEGLKLNGSAGHQWIKDNTAFGAEDYTDWSAGLSYDWEKVNFSATYYDTNIDDADCSSLCAGRVVGAITYSF